MKRRGLVINILIIVALCLITRLPQLLSRYLILDGDEAIVGLMAKHLYQGKEIPVFFYGQAYGFSLIENAVIALAYVFFGVTDYAVKISMLFLFAAGMIFFYLSLLQVNKKNKLIALLLTLAFIVDPAWAVWSLKARGGYITSFMLFPALLYFLFNKKMEGKRITWAIIGVLSVLIFYSQSLWLPGILPLIAYKIFTEQKWGAYVFALPAALLVFIPVMIVKLHAPHLWSGPGFVFSFSDAYRNLVAFPQYWYNAVTGNYDQGTIFVISGIGSIISFVFAESVALLLLAGIYNLFDKEKRNWLFIASVLSVALSILPIFF